MPVHDWTRVDAGIFHHFHQRWMSAISHVLNGGLLPPEFYALMEQIAGVGEADVLTLEEVYARKQTTLVIRHVSGDRIVAMVEVVSPGNKAGRHALRRFLEKAAEVLARGCHLLLVDLFPPSPRDPNGIHGALGEEIGENSYRQPAEKPLTVAAYDAGPPTTAFVEPVAVGQALPDMPLFLQPGAYVLVPLDSTYQAAWADVPKRWQRVLEAPPA